MKVPIDDNRRLSLRDYRSLIYDEIKKRNKSTSNFFHPFQSGLATGLNNVSDKRETQENH